MSARLRTIEELLLTCLREKWTVRPDGRSMFATDRDGLRSIEYRGTRIRNRCKQPAIDPPISERRRSESQGILSLEQIRLCAAFLAGTKTTDADRHSTLLRLLRSSPLQS